MHLPSITSHLQNGVGGVSVQVCMNLHKCGGVQNRCRDIHTDRGRKEVSQTVQ